MINELDLETLRAKAKELGVTYHPAQKAETIQANIDKHLVEAASGVVVTVAPAPVVSAPPTAAQEFERLQKEATALIPVTITSMDPSDATLTAVVVSVGNSRIGQITKAIPFGYKWFMPKILVDELASQMFLRHAMVPTGSGGERVNTQWIKKYAIQYHPMPTPEDLAELAKAQAQGNELAK